MKASSPVTSVCMRCTGTNITSGKLVSRRQEYATVFKPDNMKFWSFSYGCLDCGFIWTEADADALEDFVATKCKPVAKHS
jgi:hypothetical protein